MSARTTELCVSGDDPCLDGHFPDRPLVPAAAILDRLAAWLEADAGASVTGVTRARFKAALAPGTVWRVEAGAPSDGVVKVTCRAEGAVAMTATFVLDGPSG